MNFLEDDSWAWLQAQAAELGVPVDDAQLALLGQYHALLVAANETTNLTRIVDPREAVIKHYLDALIFLRMVPADWQDRPLRLIDVGAGAGLPGIPLLILRPAWRGVLLEAVGKKVTFMNEALAALGLTRGEAIHGRAEELARRPAFREVFDVGVARAVAGMPELLELCLPFVALGGRLIVSKGARGPEELADASRALTVLGGDLERHERLLLPEETGERHLYVIDKRDHTPAGYPRKPGMPHRKPLR